jgi:hypothetical protein
MVGQFCKTRKTNGPFATSDKENDTEPDDRERENYLPYQCAGADTSPHDFC